MHVASTRLARNDVVCDSDGTFVVLGGSGRIRLHVGCYCVCRNVRACQARVRQHLQLPIRDQAAEDRLGGQEELQSMLETLSTA